MKILEIGENIEICGLKYIVQDYLYCEIYSGCNDECFKIIDVDREKFTTNILGYYTSGDFPYCNSLEDLTKLVNALNEEYNRQQGNSKEFKVGDWITMIQKYSVLKSGEVYKLKKCQNELEGWWYVDHPTMCAAPRANIDFRHSTKKEIESVTKTDKPFEFNKWYKLGNILEYFSSEDLYYGFDINGNWFSGSRIKDDYTNDYLQINQSKFIPASDEEVKERLLEYAKEKYPIGTKLKECLQGWLKGDETGIINGCIDVGSTSVWVSGSFFRLCIYLDGKWAEIESIPIQKKWVKCNTQEEWDFVAKKLGRTNLRYFKEFGDCIGLNNPNSSHYAKPEEYYTFKEWLELNGLSIDTVELVGNGLIENTTIEYIKQQESTNRNIPIVDNVQNRLKVSPVRKRNLPEIY